MHEQVKMQIKIHSPPSYTKVARYILPHAVFDNILSESDLYCVIVGERLFSEPSANSSVCLWARYLSTQLFTTPPQQLSTPLSSS